MAQGGPTELLVFWFDAPDRFEGAIVGALERAESGGAIRIVEAVFAARDGGSGELAVARLHGGAGSLVAAVTDFRLRPERRQEVFRPAERDGVPPEQAEALADVLPPGSALAAVLVEHTWLAALEHAAERSVGRLLADRLLAADDIDVVGEVVAAVRHAADGRRPAGRSPVPGDATRPPRP